ncbi:Imm15 family immunity protein [Pseudomonas fluorescens]|nr:Imm15 family immunity protein [Pseudomonas fluorescens]
MKLVELYNKIISKEPYNNMNVFFESYESFEEIPIVSRYSRLDF